MGQDDECQETRNSYYIHRRCTYHQDGGQPFPSFSVPYWLCTSYGISHRYVSCCGRTSLGLSRHTFRTPVHPPSRDWYDVCQTESIADRTFDYSDSFACRQSLPSMGTSSDILDKLAWGISLPHKIHHVAQSANQTRYQLRYTLFFTGGRGWTRTPGLVLIRDAL